MDRDERVANNEVAFRNANESLHVTFSAEGSEEPYPFLCECGDSSCTSVILVSLDQYEQVREHPARFLIASGHKQLESERIVEDDETFQVVEKAGRAGELVTIAWHQRLSPKSDRN